MYTVPVAMESTSGGPEEEKLLYDLLAERSFNGVVHHVRTHRDGGVSVTTTYTAVIRGSRIVGISVQSRGVIGGEQFFTVLEPGQCSAVEEIAISLLATPLQDLHIEESSPYSTAVLSGGYVAIEEKDWNRLYRVAGELITRSRLGRND